MDQYRTFETPNALGPVSLRGMKPFASGGFRDVFIHPEDEAKCIKIAHSRRAAKAWYLGRSLDGNARELLEYRRLIELKVPYERYFPRLHGEIQTDLGRGVCVELLRGTDGKLPVNVLEFVKTAEGPAEGIKQFIRDEYRKFWHFCERSLILSSSVELRNVGIIQIDGCPKFVSYDVKQTKSRKPIAIADWSVAIKRHRIRRRFRRNMKKLEARLAMA